MKTPAVKHSTYQLQDIIQESLITYKRLAQDYGIDLEILDDMASDLTIVGDVNLQRRLLNLVLQNTIEHSKASRIIFSARQLLQSDKEVLLEFALVDNGFFSRQKSRSFTYFRSLAQARQLIAELGGKSELISIPGMSTTLKFIIKYNWQHTTIAGGCVGLLSAGLLAGTHVLLAEDNEVNQKVIRRILEPQGVTVDIVGNGKEALESYEYGRGMYDLIVMDLDMPGMDGYQAINYIRKKLKSDVPVIALSVGGSGLDVSFGKSERISCLQKPFTAAELIGAIQGLLLSEKEVRVLSKQAK
ncbi:MAG TPA: response regulator [Flavisolibacter sp.]|nr:response regulator [Flavisolibacter sp.]